MSTAYVVTSGEYSAYHIERVFLDPDEAKAYVGHRRADNVQVEVWPTTGAGYYKGKLYAAGWQKRPTASFDFAGHEPEWRDWHDDVAFPDAKVMTWARWEDYDGIRPQEVEVHGGVSDRDFIGPEVAVIAIGFDQARVEKVLAEQVTMMKAKLLELT